MTKKLESETAVAARFKRDQHKPFVYPIKILPLIGTAIMAVIFGFIHMLPLRLLFWVTLVTAFNNSSFNPFLKISQSVRNIQNNRKSKKSTWMLIGILAGTILGTIFTVSVLSKYAFFISFVNFIQKLLGTSIVLISGAMLCGAAFGYLTKQVSPLTGAAIAGFFAPLLPINISMTANIFLLGLLSSTLLSTLAVKAGIGAYFQSKFDHSNADGYEFMHAQNAINEDNIIAENLNVPPEAVTNLRVTILKAINSIKKLSSLSDELTHTRKPLTNSFKDIYFSLISIRAAKGKELTQAKENFKQLINDSGRVTNQSYFFPNLFGRILQPNNFRDYTQLDKLQNLIPTSMHYRTLFHQRALESALAKLKDSDDTETLQIRAEIPKAFEPFLSRK